MAAEGKQLELDLATVTQRACAGRIVGLAHGEEYIVRDVVDRTVPGGIEEYEFALGHEQVSDRPDRQVEPGPPSPATRFPDDRVRPRFRPE